MRRLVTRLLSRLLVAILTWHVMSLEQNVMMSKTKKWEEAYNGLTKISDSYLRDPSFFVQLARAAYHTNRFHEGISALDHAIALVNKTGSSSQLQLIELMSMTCDLYFRLSRDNATVLSEVVSCLQKQFRLDEANLRPRLRYDGSFWRSYGSILGELGRWNLSIAAMTRSALLSKTTQDFLRRDNFYPDKFSTRNANILHTSCSLEDTTLFDLIQVHHGKYLFYRNVSNSASYYEVILNVSLTAVSQLRHLLEEWHNRQRLAKTYLMAKQFEQTLEILHGAPLKQLDHSTWIVRDSWWLLRSTLLDDWRHLVEVSPKGLAGMAYEHDIETELAAAAKQRSMVQASEENTSQHSNENLHVSCKNDEAVLFTDAECDCHVDEVDDFEKTIYIKIESALRLFIASQDLLWVADAWHDAGLASWRLNRLDEALYFVQTAIRLFPGVRYSHSENFHLTLARIYLDLGRLDLARAALWGIADLHHPTTEPSSFLRRGFLEAIHFFERTGQFFCWECDVHWNWLPYNLPQCSCITPADMIRLQQLAVTAVGDPAQYFILAELSVVRAQETWGYRDERGKASIHRNYDLESRNFNSSGSSDKTKPAVFTPLIKKDSVGRSSLGLAFGLAFKCFSVSTLRASELDPNWLEPEPYFSPPSPPSSYYMGRSWDETPWLMMCPVNSNKRGHTGKISVEIARDFYRPNLDAQIRSFFPPTNKFQSTQYWNSTMSLPFFSSISPAQAGGMNVTNLYRTETAPSDGGSLPKAAIIYLCCSDEHEVRDLELSLSLTAKFFVDRWNYPIMVLHDYLKSSHIARISSIVHELLFHNHSKPESNSNALNFIYLEAKDWCGKVPDNVQDQDTIFGYGVGYRHMCRFFSGPPLAHLTAFAAYDWLLRLDTDSFLLGPVLDDPFQIMAQRQIKYGWISAFMDQAYFTTGLWHETKQWVQSNAIWHHSHFLNRSAANSQITLKLLSMESKPRDKRALDSVYNWIYNQLEIFKPENSRNGSWDDIRYCFASNFFVVDLKWWRSDELHSYFSHLDSTGGFYRYRWGDACVQFLMAAIFLERETEVTRFSNLFPYWHQGSVIDPERKGLFSFGEY